MKIEEQELLRIMQVLKAQMGKMAWKSKDSVLFSLKAKYGESFNMEVAKKIYDQLTPHEKEN
jgi:hypothetical protein